MTVDSKGRSTYLIRPHRYVPLVVVSLLGILGSLVLFSMFRSIEEARVSQELQDHSRIYSSALQRSIDRSVELVEALGALYAGSEEVRREDFRAFTHAILDSHSEIRALEWIPRVTGAERASYEESAQKDGFPAFQITERSADGTLITAERRDEYFPVYYVQPVSGNEAALGFDVASNAARRPSLEAARDAGAMVATDSITLVQEEGTGSGFLIFNPVYRKGASLDSTELRRQNLAGFVLGVYHIDALMAAAFRDLAADKFIIRLDNPDALEPGRTLYSQGPGSTGVNASLSAGRSGDSSNSATISARITLPGQEWTLHLIPTPDHIASHSASRHWYVLAPGLLLTFAVTGYLHTRMRRSFQFELLAAGNAALYANAQQELEERKKAEEALRLSEYRYHEIASSVPGVVFQLRMSKDGSLTFIFVSEGVHKLTGLSRGEVESAPLAMIFGMILAEDLPLVKRTIAESARTLATGAVEYRFRSTGGEIKWVKSVANPTLLADGSVSFTGVILDITDLKVAEAELERRLEVERVVARILARFVGQFDVDAAINLSLADIGTLSGADRAYLFQFRDGGSMMDDTHEWCANGVSSRIDNLKGLSPDIFPWAMSKLRNRETINIADISQLPAEAEAEKEILGSQYVKSALTIPVEAGGELAGFLGLNRVRHVEPWGKDDLGVVSVSAQIIGGVLGRVRAEQENACLFAQVEAKGRDWRRTFDAMADGVALISTERRILRANWALARLLGTTPKELIGKMCFQVVHGLDGVLADCPMTECLAEQQPCGTVRQEPHLGNRWLRMHVEPVIGPQGDVLHVVHTFADVTREKQRQLAMEGLHGLSLALSGTLAVDKVLTLAVEHADRAFGGSGSTVGIALLDKWGKHMEIAAARGNARASLEGVSLRLDQLLPEGVRNIFQEHRSWLQADLSRSSQALKDLPGFLEHRSLAVMPLVSGERALGVLFLARTEQGLPDPDEMTLIETFAREVAMALHNAQLFTRTDAELRRRITEYEALTAVLATAGASLDINKTLYEALTIAAAALGADRASVLALDETGRRAVGLSACHSGAEIESGNGLVLDVEAHPWLQAVLQRRESSVVEDSLRLPDGPERDLLLRLGIRSSLRLPIVAKGKAIGTLQFGNFGKVRAYSQEDMSLAQAFADHLASAIENARLHENTARERQTFDTIMASMSEGLVVVDGRRKIIYCNRAAEDLLGLAAEEFVGQPVDVFNRLMDTRLAGPEDARTIVKGALAGLRAGDCQFRFSLEFPKRRDVQGNLFIIRRDGKTLGSGVLMRDVTREQEVDRMKTEFISIASHELRTPMTSIYGFSELLLTRATDLPDKHRKWLETIHQEGKRLTDIIDDLLNVSRIEAGRISIELADVALGPLVSSVVDRVRPPARSNPDETHSFVIDIPEGLPEALADRDKLHQVLYNLLDNSVKYSPRGGVVSVSAGTGPAGRNILISVSDHGVGIPVEDMPKIFTRFHRVDRPETNGIRGTGLGLYIVKSLIEAMGGEVWAESRVNQGSTFFVSLPIAEQPPGKS